MCYEICYVGLSKINCFFFVEEWVFYLFMIVWFNVVVWVILVLFYSCKIENFFVLML